MNTDLIELAALLGQNLHDNQQSLATAESCTGGGIAYYLTEVSGSSAWFERGFVTYSNAAKVALLGVSETTLTAHGAVSAQTAQEMASGAIANSAANRAVAVTGVAGPDGGTHEKPVGTVFIAWATRQGETRVAHYQFDGNRQAIREQTIYAALQGCFV